MRTMLPTHQALVGTDKLRIAFFSGSYEGMVGSAALRFRSDQLRTMLPTYQALVATKKLRILVFSGLYDGMEPHLGTELWLKKLNLTVKTPARAWFDPLVRASWR